MHVKRFRSPGDFWEKSRVFLMEHEEENNLLLGVVGGLLQAAKKIGPDVFLATVEEDEQVCGAAMMTSPFPLATTELPKGSTQLVAEGLIAEGMRPKGLVAPTHTAKELSHELCQLESGLSFRTEKEMGVYRLDEVSFPVPAPEGRLVVASVDHTEVAVRYTEGFQRFVGEHAFNPAKLVGAAISEKRLFLWENGDAVSMAMWVRETPNSMAVAIVFTPEKHRKKGYASTLVAHVSQRALDKGKRFCVLFADNANPTSTEMYKRIGYKKVSDFAHLVFEEGAF